jgi:hypothetical protein
LSLVIDASILVAWLLDEKSDPRVEATFDTIARVETRAPNSTPMKSATPFS